MSNQTQEARFLVRFAATNLYQYILDTEDLSVIRGASNQLDDFVEKIPKVLNSAGLSAGIVYDGASEILLSVNTEQDAENAKARIRDLLQNELKFATGTVASVELTNKADLPSCMVSLERELRRAQLAAPSVVPPQSCLGNKACEIEGVRPAGVRKARAGKEVSDHTSVRYERGRRFRTRLLERIFGASVKNLDMQDWKQSFEDLETLNEGIAGKRSVHSKMCVIHADGNSFGTCRKELKTLDQLTQFSKLVGDSLFATLRDCLTDLLSRGKSKRILPFHVLYLSGDEFALVLPAADGVGVVQALLSNFSNAATTRLQSRDCSAARIAVEGTLTLSVGMVTCDTHEPIQRASALARDLCEGAKEHVKAPFDPEQGNVVDFAVIESGFLPGSAAQHRQQSRNCTWNTASDGRALPIRVKPLTRAAFHQLIEHVKSLKEADFPSSRMHRFCRVIREAASEQALRKACLEMYERIPHEVRAHIEKSGAHLLPKKLGDCAPDSPFVESWFDRKAIWDYVI